MHIKRLCGRRQEDREVTKIKAIVVFSLRIKKISIQGAAILC